MIVEASELQRQRPATADDSEIPPSEVYRSVSKSAVLTLVFGIFSLTAWVSQSFLLFPLLGVATGIVAWVGFRRYPMELVGRPMLKIGGTISLIMLFAGTGWHVYCYYTEVPPNYDRISYRMLRLPSGSRLPYNKAAEELDGKKVFVKGYVRPSDRRTDLKNFILVGDFGSCCFGGSPKMTDVIAVTLEGNLRVDYSWQLRHIGGVFRLNKTPKRTTEKDVPQVVYSIEADYLK